MKKKIIVAGAGHGGLICAAKLAKAGYEVHLLERAPLASLGHDWEDRFTFDILENALGQKIPDDAWRYRGDCKFVSPSHRTDVLIRYDDATRQKVMWRKPLIKMLIQHAIDCGVVMHEGVTVTGPILLGDRVAGINTDQGEFDADMVIDALGVFSPLRTALPDSAGIEREVSRGDVFYAYRAYFDLKYDPRVEYPFEVYLYHECEQGLSWFLTNPDNCDVLIGRIDPLTDAKVTEQLDIFARNHPWLGDRILHGGHYGVIPVRRPLGLFVYNGYAAVGDSAFMTTPMNGMGIDLSLQAGLLLADTIMAIETPTFDAKELWTYNREYHRRFGGETARNEGLKNALLSLPAAGVDFLFDNRIVQAADLKGAGRDTRLGTLLGKLIRGLRRPDYFFAILKGISKGSKLQKIYCNVPAEFDMAKIENWQNQLSACSIKIE